MRSKRISTDEQLKLIMECRQSGLSDYQWCQMHEIKPGTFYNWVSRLRKRGAAIPLSSGRSIDNPPRSQEVVKVELMPDQNLVSTQIEQNACFVANPTTTLQPAAEILIGNTTIRFFNNTGQELVEATLKYLGGILYAR